MGEPARRKTAGFFLARSPGPACADISSNTPWCEADGGAFQGLDLTGTMPGEIQRAGMRRRAFIGIVTLAVSHLAFANASSALAQAGSVGGTIGKQNKSISGGEEADRPRAAPVPKRAAAKVQETPSARSCNRIVGTWSWYPSVNESIFHKDGTALHPASGTTGKWSCAGNTVNVVWSNGGTAGTDRMTLSQDGNSISVVSPYGGGIKFTGTRRGQD
jgi:hypothetical protein